MSDESQPKQGDAKDYTKKVSPEQGSKVSNFLNEKVGGMDKDACPVCGEVQSIVLGNEYALPVGQTEPLLGIGAHIPAYATACLNCGFLRFFSKMFIDEAAAKKTNEGGDQ